MTFAQYSLEMVDDIISLQDNLRQIQVLLLSILGVIKNMTSLKLTQRRVKLLQGLIIKWETHQSVYTNPDSERTPLIWKLEIYRSALSLT